MTTGAPPPPGQGRRGQGCGRGRGRGPPSAPRDEPTNVAQAPLPPPSTEAVSQPRRFLLTPAQWVSCSGG
ncbi:UNVERIFIED_CONTAM: hypothetical protein Slati_3708900 [Sesamum latifolium]|uniref:Uncharacterized protein n=1 Tax=Sesamum latifolium TaxID=2727402 RepID=A0AAW2U2X0_9LAMI